ncbi:MAG: UDP-N-acetylmuramoyl-L-alanine--D-glutamate ligase [Candidatus Beckwithbacteria bacterium]|nr:UDP-N-acetylmuramoyl-L-alanine--D-glutamate ligase [Candidatus Beckwithbacteria bacterium]
MQFIDKNIAVLGSGKEGRDVYDWLKTNSRGCRIKVFDKIKAVDLAGFDIVFRSPGFYRYSPMIVKAETAGAIISSATKLFFDQCPAKIIAVTGTKGKGTTTSLIYQILQNDGQSAYIAGNIGKPMLSLLPRLKAGDWVCLELSSFQLQDLTKSPHIAVVLNITSDHLDVHKSTKEYRGAKTSILKYQHPSDHAVLNVDYPVTKKMAVLTPARIHWFSGRRVNLDVTRIKLRGEHNRENIAAAMAAAGLAGVAKENMTEAVFKFKGLEHRLELVRKVNAITFYNDSFSTTPETAIAAIKSFFEPMTIILGGSEKGSDYRRLGRVIVASKNVRNLILIGKTAGKIKAAVSGFSGAIITGLTTMKAVVTIAGKISLPGSVVVLTPACASFDMFTDYQDRGNQFKLWVKKL